MRLLSFLFALSVLWSCSSTDNTRINSPIEKPAKEVVVQESETPISADQMLATARAQFEIMADIEQRTMDLLRVANQYRIEQQCDKTLVILNAIKDDINTAYWQNEFNLLLAECAPRDALSITERLSLVQYPLADTSARDRQLSIQSEGLAENGRYLEAANANVSRTVLNETDLNDVWNWVNKTGQKDREQALSQYPNLRPWLAVVSMLNRYGDNPQQLRQAFQSFQQQYPDHPLAVEPPQSVIDGVSATSIEPQNIVVLLPLSSRLAAQGNAIKQGILTAYFARESEYSDSQLSFVDTAEWQDDTIRVAVENADLVIGPLLKENIERTKPLLQPNTVLVALNRVDRQMDAEPLTALPSLVDEQEQETASSVEAPQFYFALAPEDEAEQLAMHVYSQGYREPVLVHGQDPINQRLAAAFLSKWRELNRQADNSGIQIVSYDTTETMREGVGDALDVNQSKQRIRQIEQRMIPELYNVPRNRRDVDAIVAFASPEHTELLNPVIESSLSPFNNKAVPVYVTSRSVRIDASKNQMRDLQNVHFIDMPWMMPTHNWLPLAAELERLYPNQRDALKRLFALGYDAFQQISSLPHLAAVPQLNQLGMSGNLTVNAHNEVTRALPLAVIDGEQIIVLKMPE